MAGRRPFGHTAGCRARLEGELQATEEGRSRLAQRDERKRKEEGDAVRQDEQGDMEMNREQTADRKVEQGVGSSSGSADRWVEQEENKEPNINEDMEGAQPKRKPQGRKAAATRRRMMKAAVAVVKSNRRLLKGNAKKRKRRNKRSREKEGGSVR
jgi:hypothetical protein